MGSLIWAVDMIINIKLRPMENSYQFKEYETAANMLYQINSFLKPFGAGITDLPKPQNVISDVTDRTNPNRYYKLYYEKYAPVLYLSIAKHLADLLKDVRVMNKMFVPSEDAITKQDMEVTNNAIT